MTLGKIACLIGDLVFFIVLAVGIHNVNIHNAVDVSISAAGATSAEVASNRTAAAEHRYDDKLILVFGLLSWLLRIGTMSASILLQYAEMETVALLLCIVVYLAGSIGWLVSLIVTYRYHYAGFCVIGMLGYGFMMFWCIFTALISCFYLPNTPIPKVSFHFGPRAELPISIPRFGLRRQSSPSRPRATSTPLPGAAAPSHRAEAQSMVSGVDDLAASRRHVSLKQKISEVKLEKAALLDQNLKLVHDKDQLVRDNGRIIEEKAAAEERSVQLSLQVNDLRSLITVLEMPAEMRAAECPICCDTYSEKRLAAFVPCGHTMCAVCALQIFESLKTCSSCRKQITAVQTIHFNSV